METLCKGKEKEENETLNQGAAANISFLFKQKADITSITQHVMK